MQGLELAVAGSTDLCNIQEFGCTDIVRCILCNTSRRRPSSARSGLSRMESGKYIDTFRFGGNDLELFGNPLLSARRSHLRLSSAGHV